MQDAMSAFLSGRSDDYVDLDQNGVSHKELMEAAERRQALTAKCLLAAAL